MSNMKSEEWDEGLQKGGEDVLECGEGTTEERREGEESFFSGSYDDCDDEITDEEEGDEEDYMSDEEQENPLLFKTFPLDELRGQHIMAVATSKRFVLFGTNRGVVMLVEMTGNVFRVFNNHSDPISDISSDVTEGHIGSCDKAGVVTVQSLRNEQDVYRKEFDFPIQSMGLHPYYSQKEERPIVLCGRDKVILISKTNFLGHRKTTIIQEREGKIYAVRWCGPDVIAWASSCGVQLYCFILKSMLQLVARPSDSPRLEFCRCSLFWEPENTLICGWGDWVQVIHLYDASLEKRPSRRVFETAPCTYRVDVMPPIRTLNAREPFEICGIAPFGTDRFFLLACTFGQEDFVMKDLEVRLVERLTFTEVYRGRLQTKYNHPLQFGLAFLDVAAAQSTETPSTNKKTKTTTPSLVSSSNSLSTCAYFIVCVDTVIKAMPPDDDHHVEYLLSRGRFEEAYEHARTHSLRRIDMLDVGSRFQEHLLAEKRYDELVTCMGEILADNYAEWERWIFKFDQQGVSDLLVDVLPVPGEKKETENKRGGEENAQKEEGLNKKKNRIAEEYYELVLFKCLGKNVLTFYRAMQRFKGMFRPDVLSQAVGLHHQEMKLQGGFSKLSAEEKKALGDAYGLLLRLSGHQEEAFKVLLGVTQSDELFALIREEGLFVEAMEMLHDLFARNEEKTIELLLGHLRPTYSSTHKEGTTDAQVQWKVFAPAAVVRRLERTSRKYLWAYLKALQSFDEAAYVEVLKTHAQLVAMMYIKNDPSSLLSFLRQNADQLPRLQEIYALCKKHQLLDAMVFLLARMGKEEEGLRIIVNDMKDMNKAVRLIAEITNSDDQFDLYKKLVHMVFEVNSTFFSHKGEKYFEHRIEKGETWKSIALKYNVNESELRTANDVHTVKAQNKNLDIPTSDTCIVPLNLIGALLNAVVDPLICGGAALDPTYIIDMMPKDEPMPRVGNYIATVVRSKADDTRLMQAVLQVMSNDLVKHNDTLYRRRKLAICVEPGVAICSFCHRLALGGVIIFSCSHVYHITCIIAFLDSEGILLVQPSEIDSESFLRHPEIYLRPHPRQTLLRCVVCSEMRETIRSNGKC